MLISLMALALAAYEGPDGVIATAPATPAPPLAATADPATPTDSPVTTVQSATPHSLTTDEQIARWIDRRQSGGPVFAEDQGPTDDRKLHGEVSAGIGTGGYRDVGVWMSIPIGETGRLDLNYSQTENGLFPYYRDPRGFDRYYRDPDAPFSVRPADNRQDAWDERIRRRRSPAHPPSALDERN
jgi:hypothetical protein